MMTELKILLILLPVLTSSYDSEYGKTFKFTCPRGEVLTNIESSHSDNYGDRKFNFTCSMRPAIESCRWHDFANDFGEIMLFQCPDNSVISGVESYHRKIHEDRRFKFYCCYFGMLLSDCLFSDSYANELDKTFYYNVPYRRMLRGIFSYYDTSKEDRHYKFETCGTSHYIWNKENCANPVKGIDLFTMIMQCNVKP